MPKIEPATRKISVNPMLKKVREYLAFKKKIDDMSSQQKAIRDDLMEIVQEHGVEDDKGHIWLPLPEEVEGVTQLQAQRKVSSKLDMDAAVAILATKGLADRCIKTIPTVDEDEVMACLYDGLLTEGDVDKMFPKTVTYAFYTKK
jgi:hypothetical protein